MIKTLFAGRSAERFSRLLDQNGQAAQSRSNRDLAPLVLTAQQLLQMPIRVEARPQFKNDLLSVLKARVKQDGLGVTAAVEQKPARTFRARISVIVGVALSLMTASGVSLASSGALPGGPLYSVKITTEEAKLAITGAGAVRGRLHLEFARTRLGEAHSIRDGDDGPFFSVIFQMDTETQEGVKALTAVAVEKGDLALLDEVDKFVADQHKLLEQLVSAVSEGKKPALGNSIARLRIIAMRSGLLRPGITCHAEKVGDDALGPITAPCPNSGPATQSPTGPETNPSLDPNVSSAPASPATPETAPTTPATPTPTPGIVEGIVDGIGGIVSGLGGQPSPTGSPNGQGKRR